MKKLSTAASIRILFGLSSVVVAYLYSLSESIELLGIAIAMASVSILATRLVNFWEKRIDTKIKLVIRIWVAACIFGFILYGLIRSGMPILKGGYFTAFMFGALGWMITDTIKLFREVTKTNSEPVGM